MIVGIVDYGAGNLLSLKNALQRIPNLDVCFVTNEEELQRCSAIVLPGVGSFASSMENLQSKGLIAPLGEIRASGDIPILGICLGFQLFGLSSSEGYCIDGLGWIDCEVIPFNPSSDYKVPHVGWNTVQATSGHNNFCCNFSGDFFYFDHSYHTRLTDNARYDCLATCSYTVDFPAIFVVDNLVGVQFHPEKSGPSGLRFLKSFFERC